MSKAVLVLDKMPTSCWDCPLRHDGIWEHCVPSYHMGLAKRMDWAERLLNAIFGDEDDGHEYCIFLEPMGEDNGSWFSQWIKHRDDLPQSTKDWLEAAGVEPGESVPMFTGGNAPVMRFKYKGMAEKTAEKIAEMYPQFEGKLHVQIYEEMPNNGPQE